MKKMRIFLDTPMGLRFPVDVDPKEKVYKLKKKAVQMNPTATLLLKFFFQGKELDQTTTLEDNRVHENSSIFVDLIEKTRQRGRAPRGSGGPGLFPWIPESWLWYILIGGLLLLGVSYRDALVPFLGRDVPPVPVPPVPVDVPNVVVPLPSIPMPDYEKTEEDEEYMVCIVAIQWPKSHVLDKGLDPIYMQLVPQDRSVLHGLWCDVKIADPSLPFDCSMVVDDDRLFRSASRNWPNLDPRNPRVELIDHNCKFWADEWDKHGVDTGLTQEVYMKVALTLFHRVALPLDIVLRRAIGSAGASSSSSKHHASNSGKCEAQDLEDFVLVKKKKHRKPEVYLNILELESVLAQELAKPKVLCRTPPDKMKIFHSVNLKVKVTKSASAFPLCTFLHFHSDKQCDKWVILP